MAGADALAELAAALEQRLVGEASALNMADAERLSVLFEAYRAAIVERGMAS
jgi:hypothetical protein